MNLPLQTWIDGERVTGPDPSISLNSETVLYGRGLFETLRLHSGRIPCWDLHERRIRAGAEDLGFDFGTESLGDHLRSLPGLFEIGDARLRLRLLHDGESDRPMIVLQAFHLPSRLIEPVALVVTDVERSMPVTDVRRKTSSYLDELLVTRHAASLGAFDGIMVRPGKIISEGSRCNLFFLLEGEICTPDESTGLLPGVGREAVLRGAAEEGRTIRTGEYPVDSFRLAREVVVVSSLRGVVPVGRVLGPDGEELRPAGRGSGALCSLLQTYFDRQAEATALVAGQGGSRGAGSP